MKIQFTIILLFSIVMLPACTSNYVYVKPNYSTLNSRIDQVVIVVEYLHLREKMNGTWVFDEAMNMKYQDQLFSTVKNQLNLKNYTVSESKLLSSGLIVDRNFNVEHIINKEKQLKSIFPPYVLRITDLTDENTQGLEALLAELNKPLSVVMTDLRPYVKNKYLEQTNLIKLEENTAVLLIQVNKSKFSPFINMGADFHPTRPKGKVYGYFIDIQTGDLIWSNQANALTSSNAPVFFNELPLFNGKES